MLCSSEPPRTNPLSTSDRPLPWRDIGMVLLCALVVPFTLYLALALVSALTLSRLLTVVGIYFVTMALFVLLEAVVAFPAQRRRTSGSLGIPFPKVTALVVAYLPNEQGIILTTINHLLNTVDVPRDKLQVILAYNTPDDLPVERELQHLAAIDPRFLLLRVDGSQSKAENINAALPYITGEVTGLFDSDHLPEPACFDKAVRWIQDGYDAVQGRCVIRNEHENCLTRMIAIEFAIMYAVLHTAGSVLTGTAVFGGSNGYWRTQALRSLRMEQAMLTEDIDVTVRALLAGYRLVHDRSLVSTELAPTTVSGWFYQRLRWAQGWYQATRKHTRAVAGSAAMNRWQRLYWMYMLPCREANAALAPQGIAIILALATIQAWVQGTWSWDSYLAGMMIMALLGDVPLTLVAYKHRSGGRSGTRAADLLAYILCRPLFLALMLNLIALVSWLREFRHQRDWIVTARGNAEYKPAEVRVTEAVPSGAREPF